MYTFNASFWMRRLFGRYGLFQTLRCVGFRIELFEIACVEIT